MLSDAVLESVRKISEVNVKIGIFGGSFNPIHKGHVFLAQNILNTGIVDKLWFVVSPCNPLKEKGILQDDMQRLANVCKATEHIKNVVVSDVEFHLPKPSYMYLTLRRLRQIRPQDELFLIIGADNWLCFDSWKEPDEILNNYKILIYPRKGCSIDHKLLPPNVQYLNLPLYDISSTTIRQMISKGEDISDFVP